MISRHLSRRHSRIPFSHRFSPAQRTGQTFGRCSADDACSLLLHSCTVQASVLPSFAVQQRSIISHIVAKTDIDVLRNDGPEAIVIDEQDYSEKLVHFAATGRLKQAISLFHIAKLQHPDELFMFQLDRFNILLSLVAKSGQWKMATELLRELLLARAQPDDTALRHKNLNALNPNDDTILLLLRAYIVAGHVEQAQQLLHTLEQNAASQQFPWLPSREFYEKLALLFIEFNLMSLGTQIIQSLERRYAGAANTRDASLLLVRKAMLRGDFRLATVFIDDLQRRGISMDMEFFEAMMEGICKQCLRAWEQARIMSARKQQASEYEKFDARADQLLSDAMALFQHIRERFPELQQPSGSIVEALTTVLALRPERAQEALNFSIEFTESGDYSAQALSPKIFAFLQSGRMRVAGWRKRNLFQQIERQNFSTEEKYRQKQFAISAIVRYFVSKGDFWVAIEKQLLNQAKASKMGRLVLPDQETLQFLFSMLYERVRTESSKTQRHVSANRYILRLQAAGCDFDALSKQTKEQIVEMLLHQSLRCQYVPLAQRIFDSIGPGLASHRLYILVITRLLNLGMLRPALEYFEEISVLVARFRPNSEFFGLLLRKLAQNAGQLARDGRKVESAALFNRGFAIFNDITSRYEVMMPVDAYLVYLTYYQEQQRDIVGSIEYALHLVTEKHVPLYESIHCLYKITFAVRYCLSPQRFAFAAELMRLFSSYVQNEHYKKDLESSAEAKSAILMVVELLIQICNSVPGFSQYSVEIYMMLLNTFKLKPTAHTLLVLASTPQATEEEAQKWQQFMLRQMDHFKVASSHKQETLGVQLMSIPRHKRLPQLTDLTDPKIFEILKLTLPESMREAQRQQQQLEAASNTGDKQE